MVSINDSCYLFERGAQTGGWSQCCSSKSDVSGRCTLVISRGGGSELLLSWDTQERQEGGLLLRGHTLFGEQLGLYYAHHIQNK